MTHDNGNNARKELPAGWRWARLGDVGRIGSGITLGRTFFSEDTRSVPYLRVANVKDGYLDLSGVYNVEVPERDIERCRLQFGDLLLTEGGDPDKLGRGTFWENQLPECIHQNHIFRVRFDLDHLLPQFVSYQMQSPYGKAYFLAHAKQTTGIATINQQVLARFPLMIPSFVEQQAIARRLDRDMAEVTRLRAAAERQRAAAAALPSAYLREVFESVEARGWPVVRLGGILRLRKDVVHPYDHPTGPAIFVGLEHIESHTGRRIGSLDVDMSTLSGRKPRFFQGDLVYGYLRPYLNKVWLAEFDGLCSVDQYVYSVNLECALTQFIAAFLRSPIYLKRAPIDTTPGQLPRIRTEEVTSVELALPSLSEQYDIVQKLENNRAETTQIRNAVDRQRHAIDAMPAALLREVFGGFAREGQ
jgi:type I restriction enzyme S subunit